MIFVTRKYEFSAAHRIKEVEKCQNRHGHNFTVYVKIGREHLSSSGMVMEFGEIDEIVKPLIDDLDHIEIIEKKSPGWFFGQPTAENIALNLFKIISGNINAMPENYLNHPPIRLHSVTIYENDRSSAEVLVNDD